jgi:hypothetical protein
MKILIILNTETLRHGGKNSVCSVLLHLNSSIRSLYSAYSDCKSEWTGTFVVSATASYLAVTEPLNSPRLQPEGCGGMPFSRALAQYFPVLPNGWAKAPVVCGDYHTHRLKPGANQTDMRGVSATALSLAVTGVVKDIKCKNIDTHAGDRTNPNRVWNPVRVTRDCDGGLHLPPTPASPHPRRGLPPQGEEKGQTFFRGGAVVLDGMAVSDFSIFSSDKKPLVYQHGEDRRCPPLLRGGRGCVTVFSHPYFSKEIIISNTETLCELRIKNEELRIRGTMNTARHLIILNSQFSILNSPVRVTRDCDGGLHLPPTPSTRGGAVVLAGIAVSDSMQEKKIIIYGIKPANVHLRNVSPSLGGGRGEVATANTYTTCGTAWAALYVRYHNTPPTPSQEGRAERRGAVIGNTGRHCERSEAIAYTTARHQTQPLNSPRLQSEGCDGTPFSRALAQCFPVLPNIWAKAPVVCGDYHTHRLKPGAIQTDMRGVSAAASCLAVTGISPNRWPERPDFHNRRSTTCGGTTVSQSLPERQDMYEWTALYVRYHNTPPAPSQEGRAERRGAVYGNTGSYLIIFNSQFSILNSKEGRASASIAVSRIGRANATNKGACPLAVCPQNCKSEWTGLYVRYHNTPPTPSSPHPLRDFPHKGKKKVKHSSEGRAERRGADRGNTARHLIILNSQFSILNSKEGWGRGEAADYKSLYSAHSDCKSEWTGCRKSPANPRHACETVASPLQTCGTLARLSQVPCEPAARLRDCRKSPDNLRHTCETFRKVFI